MLFLLPAGRTIAAPVVRPSFAVHTPLQTGEQLSIFNLIDHN